MVLEGGYTNKAIADCVTTNRDGTLVLEGHVHIFASKDHIEVDAGKVIIKMKRDVQGGDIIQTGVITSPSLVQ